MDFEKNGQVMQKEMLIHVGNKCSGHWISLQEE